MLKWCLDPESNQGHADFQSAALPTELSRHQEMRLKLIIKFQGFNSLQSHELV